MKTITFKLTDKLIKELSEEKIIYFEAIVYGINCIICIQNKSILISKEK